MGNNECEGCKMQTLYDDLTVCPLCLWEQDCSRNDAKTQTTTND